MNRPEQPTAVFVADSHFHLIPDDAERRRVDRFCQLLELSTRADHLVLLGDIFDFWFDYPHFRLKGYETLLRALDRVRESGTTIHFVGGNHDIWATDYMHRRYGCVPRGEADIVEFGERRICLRHGDGLFKLDWAYNAFRAMVRNPLGIFLAKSLHPEILYGLSSWLSGRSRGATRDEAATIERRARRWLARHHTAPWDLVVVGHVHHPFVASEGPKTLATLAGWLDPLGYAVLRQGRFALLDFDRDPLPDL